MSANHPNQTYRSTVGGELFFVPEFALCPTRSEIGSMSRMTTPPCFSDLSPCGSAKGHSANHEKIIISITNTENLRWFTHASVSTGQDR